MRHVGDTPTPRKPHVLLATPTEDPTVLPSAPGEEVTAATGNIVESLLEAIPRLVLAVVVLAVVIGIALLLRRVLRKRLTEARNESFGNVFSKLAYGLVVVAGVLLATSILLPSIAPGDLLAGLGVFSIAIGFAFQDILSNLLAGILLLLRQPFEIGDQIEVSGHTGTVEEITIRETQIKTFKGEKIIVPNAETYQQTIRVQTAYGPKRTDLVIGLEDDQDQDVVTDVILDALQPVEGVLDDPEPQVYFTGYGDFSTNCDVRYWTQPQQAEVRGVQDRVVRAISRALTQTGIPMPSPIREIDARSSLKDALGDE